MCASVSKGFWALGEVCVLIAILWEGTVLFPNWFALWLITICIPSTHCGFSAIQDSLLVLSWANLNFYVPNFLML